MLTQETVARPRRSPPPSAAPMPLVAILGPALVSGGLLYLCYFPFDWGWLAWIALVPLLLSTRSLARPRTVYWSAWAGGLVCYWPALQWMRVADERMYFTWAFLATYCALYFPLALYLIRLLVRRADWPLVVAVPVVWTALEFFRSFFGTGFSWYLLAHTQHQQLPLIQFADLAGAWGVTFLVAAVNGFLCECCLAWLGRSVTTRRALAIQAIALVAAFGVVVTYSIVRMQSSFAAGPRIALVQGNLPQAIRNNPTSVRSIFDHYGSLSDVAARAEPALIVWPETSLPVDWDEVWPSGPTAEVREFFHAQARRFKTPTLYGLNATVVASDRVERRYNSALLIDAVGNAVARYDKIHRVPMGEYVPLRDWLPFMNYFAPYDFDYSVTAGVGHTRFPLGEGKNAATFGTVICYEDTDPDTTRPYGGGDGRPPADFLLNISNDGWFDGTSEHEEHLAICRFRAIESRRAVGRAVNMGISALIDSNGRVLAPREVGRVDVASGVGAEPIAAVIWEVGPSSPELPTHRWGEFKKVAGVLLASVPLDGRSSVYAVWGDWLPWSCWAVLAIGLWRGRKSAAR